MTLTKEHNKTREPLTESQTRAYTLSLSLTHIHRVLYTKTKKYREHEHATQIHRHTHLDMYTQCLKHTPTHIHSLLTKNLQKAAHTHAHTHTHTHTDLQEAR